MSGVCCKYCKMHIQFCWANLNKKDHLGDLGRNGRTILKWISKKWDGIVWTEFI